MKVSELRDLMKKESIPIPKKGSGVNRRVNKVDLIEAILGNKEVQKETKEPSKYLHGDIRIEKKKKKIYNVNTKCWMAYDGQAFKKRVREGEFDSVLPKKELARLKIKSARGRPKGSGKKSPKRSTKKVSPRKSPRKSPKRSPKKKELLVKTSPKKSHKRSPKKKELLVKTSPKKSSKRSPKKNELNG